MLLQLDLRISPARPSFIGEEAEIQQPSFREVKFIVQIISLGGGRIGFKPKRPDFWAQGFCTRFRKVWVILGFYSDLYSGLSYSFNLGCCPITGSLWVGATMWQVEGGEVGCGGQKSASQPLLRGSDSFPKNTFREVKVKIRKLASGKEENHQGLMRAVPI